MKLKKRSKGLADISGRYSPRTIQKPKLKVEENVERLVAVAIKRDGEIHHGFKAHWELRASLGDDDPHNRKRGDEEGFWTSLDRFVGRYEAGDIGRQSGQVFSGGKELLSSDVDWD